MFSRLFGKKNQVQNDTSAEQVQQEDAQEKATAAMVEIKKTIDSLEKKVAQKKKSSDENLRAAAELKKKNPKDPQIKILLTKVKKDREDMEKYNSVILKQEANLTAVEDASFISEMYEIMETTKTAIQSAVAGVNDKMRDLMDEIEDLKTDIGDVMDMLVTNETEDPDLGELDDELDAMLADGMMNEPENQLPSAPTTVLTGPEPEAKPEEDDLDAMLAELASFVCLIKTRVINTGLDTYVKLNKCSKNTKKLVYNQKI